MTTSDKKAIELGIKIADSKIYHEDKVWSRYSNDKVDIGEELAAVIRRLSKALPLSRAMRAVSIGSSAEPQFRILETAFRGGLYLVDLEKEALSVVKERIRRQWTDHVTTVLADYTKIFANARKAKAFLRKKLDGKNANLVTFHHSLYYCREEAWRAIFENVYDTILDKKSAIHAVLMASASDDCYTTTWLYNHFVGKCFGCKNDQDLGVFKKELEKDRVFKKSGITLKTNCVRFFVDDFEKFMAVVWMVLLYPSVHKYTLRQREEITEFIYKRFWKRRVPLVQAQDHLTIYKGV